MRKALISPQKYVQGEDELLNLGYFVKQYGDKAMLIAHPDDVNRVRTKLQITAERFGVEFFAAGFVGECSRQEIARVQALAKEKGCNCTIGLGGGKAIDTAKCVAEGENLIIVPTIAATDAPTSHSAVVYTPEGAFDDYFYFKANPNVILIDTTVIAAAPTRFLVSGMGDALSTYFEARANVRSNTKVNAGLPCGVREGICPPAYGTRAAFALAELCYKNLLEFGSLAKEASDRNEVTDELEMIVETNILLSGLGFESAGLGAAHAIHDGLTVLEETHHYTHGEKVSFGTICQLALEKANGTTTDDEINEVLGFCTGVGLPVCLEDIGVTSISDEKLREVAEKSCIPEESIYAMPFKVTVEGVMDAILTADQIGKAYKENH
ncbi:MAG: glycerol dehydrogenase [Lachnospiraceae bacterium]